MVRCFYQGQVYFPLWHVGNRNKTQRIIERDSKRCIKCKVEKEKNMFDKRRGSKDGMYRECKKCRSLKNIVSCLFCKADMHTANIHNFDPEVNETVIICYNCKNNGESAR